MGTVAWTGYCNCVMIFHDNLSVSNVCHGEIVSCYIVLYVTSQFPSLAACCSMVCDPCDGETPVDSVSVVPAGYEVNWSKSTEYKCSVESEAIKLK